MSHKFDSGAFYKEGAWHGLGTVVNEKLTSAEFMVKSKMNWEVISKPAYDEHGNQIPKWKRIIRSDNNSLLHISKESWTPLQNWEAFSFFDPFIQDGDLYLSAAVSLAGGKRIAVTAEFSEKVQAEIVGDDFVELKLVLYNSHDQSLSVGVKFTPIRVVCNNTLNMVVDKEKFSGDFVVMSKTAKIKHTRQVSKNLEKLREYIDLSKRVFLDSTVAEYKHMASKQLSTDLWKKYLSLVFNKEEENVQKKLRNYGNLTYLMEYGTGQDIPGVSGTMWAAYNAVTDFLSHKNKVDSMLFGNYKNVIRKAHELALKI